MNKKWIYIVLGIAAVGFLILGYVNLKSQNLELTAENSNATKDEVRTPSILIQGVMVREVEEGVVDPGVYATLSNGEIRFIAQSDDFRKTQDPEQADNYRDAKISPNGQFVALAGIGFEEEFVRVYNVKTDVLHEKIYAISNVWTTDGLLRIRSCDLSGESCVDKISVSADTPWSVKNVPGTATGSSYEN